MHDVILTHENTREIARHASLQSVRFAVGPFFVLPLSLFLSFGRGAQELGTVTRIVVAGRARIVVAVAKRRTVVAFGLLCFPRVSEVFTVTGIGGVLVAKLRTVVAFGLACCPRISEGLHICFCSCVAFRWIFCGRSLELGL